MTAPILALALALAGGPKPVPDSLHVEVSGTGPTVVFLPGLFGAAYGFRRVTPLVRAAGYRVVIIEPLGVGSSSRPPNADYSLAAQADRIAAVIDTLGGSPVILVAHSLGGAMAFRIAVRHPTLVRGLLSLEGGPTEEATTPSFRRALRFAPLLRIFGGAGIVRSKVRGMLKESSGDPAWVTDSVVHGYTDGAAKSMGATIHAFQAMGRAHEPELLQPRLGEIKVPVRMIVGGLPNHEGSLADGEVALLARRLDSFGVDTIPGIGHYPQEEQPAAIIRALERLEATIAASARADRHQE